MPTHYWGDGWFEKNGKDLDDAIHFCIRNWRRWGRLGSYGKEKYGTFRHHVSFYSGYWPIHELVNPGYAYYQWPKFLFYFEIDFVRYLVQYSGLAFLIRKWQEYIYNAVLQLAVKKYKHLKDELIEDCEFHLLRPGMWGSLDGNREESNLWTEVTADVCKDPVKVTMDSEDLIELYQEALDSLGPDVEITGKGLEQLEFFNHLLEGHYDDFQFDTFILPEGDDT